MKILVIESCTKCPFYKTKNNEYRYGSVGELSICTVQDNKEIDFTDKSEITDLHNKIHNSCKLDDN
jgi:hypothetical protein